MTKDEGSNANQVNGVFFKQEWDLSLTMQKDMFPDEEHILRVSYELEFQKEKDTANLQVSSLIGNSMLAVQSKIYASAAEFRSIDMGLSVNQLNLN